MKKKNVTKWIITIIGAVVAMIIAYIYETHDRSLREANKALASLTTRQVEFQKDLQAIEKTSLEDKKINNSRYKELNTDISKIKSIFIELKVNQDHILSQNKEIYSILRSLSKDKRIIL